MLILRKGSAHEESPPGQRNRRIIEYHSTTTLRATDDETPRCSSFVKWVMKIQVAIILLLALSPGCLFAGQTGAETATKDFQSFWTEFRQAIKANDKDKVASMTRFPFKTRGQTDSDPVKSHTKESFMKIWDKILEADPGLSPETDTMRRYVERKATITSKDLGSGKGSARVGTFVFEKVQGKWLFTMAYLDE